MCFVSSIYCHVLSGTSQAVYSLPTAASLVDDGCKIRNTKTPSDRSVLWYDHLSTPNLQMFDSPVARYFRSLQDTLWTNWKTLELCLSMLLLGVF